jgi:hypothetical protein
LIGLIFCLAERKEIHMSMPRRRFIAACCLVPVGAVLAQAAVAADAACGGAMSLSQRNRRRALNYLDVSADPARHCGLCTYFTAGEGGCGACQMLSGGAVNATGVCNSFTAKAR